MTGRTSSPDKYLSGALLLSSHGEELSIDERFTKFHEERVGSSSSITKAFRMLAGNPCNTSRVAFIDLNLRHPSQPRSPLLCFDCLFRGAS